MRCYNCVHFEICILKEECGCSKFKDKAKFIELPCAIGDKVYKIEDEVVKEFKIFDFHLYEEEAYMYAINKETTQHYIDRFYIFDFGKTVFLTKQKAIQKLKEMKQNDNVHK